MSRKSCLILGANSGIARAIARRLCTMDDYELVLVARDAQKLAACAQDLHARSGAKVHCETVNFLDLSAVRKLFQRLSQAACAPFDLVLVCYGVMYSNTRCAEDLQSWNESVTINFASTALCLERAFALFDPQRGGELAVVSSVAGDRGRPKNFYYGSTKAGLDAFVEGFRLAHHGSAVNIMNFRPGPVDTPMAADSPKGLLWASPEQVAEVFCAALGRRRYRVYAPRYWRLVMWVVRMLPGRLLARLGI